MTDVQAIQLSTVIITATLGFAVFYLAQVLRECITQLALTVGQLPAHAESRRPIVPPTLSPAHTGDVRIHIPRSLMNHDV